MKNKIYYLSTCSTCARIMKSLGIGNKFEKIDIKANSISPDELDKMAKFAGSYEALFSRRAIKYRARGLHERKLSEAEIRELILEEYTFLKRPVIQHVDQYFIGNSKKVIEAANKAING